MCLLVNLSLSAESLDAIVEAVRDRITSELCQASPWMTRAQAAEYLGVPVSRLEKDRRMPSDRWEGRVMYHRGELDEDLLGFGSVPIVENLSGEPGRSSSVTAYLVSVRSTSFWSAASHRTSTPGFVCALDGVDWTVWTGRISRSAQAGQ